MKSKPWNTYENRGSRAENTSIYIYPSNKYGYQININHPKINGLYRRYLKWKGIPQWCPLSDAQRFEFEAYIFGLLRKGKLRKDENL